MKEAWRGVEAAYKRLVLLADADNAGPVRRVARDLTTDALHYIVGMAAFDCEHHPYDFSYEMVMHVCMEECKARKVAQ